MAGAYPTTTSLAILETLITGYKSFSTAAVISAVFALVSVVSFLMPGALVLTVPSLACAVMSLLRGRRYPVAGHRLAMLSIGVCTWLLINVPVTFYVAYKAESPVGYARLDFAEASRNQSLHTHLGKPVCLKGFPLMYSWGSGVVTEMFVSPDGNKRYSKHAIHVELKSGTSWSLYSEPLAVSGILVERQDPNDEVKYVLQDAVIRKSRTPFGIAMPANNQGY